MLAVYASSLMTQDTKLPVIDADDVLAKPRKSVAGTIEDLQSFTGTAGSPEMRAVTAAIEYLGYAYSILQARGDNPAWS